MDPIRKSYQGVWNIIQFNWHFYVLSIVSISALILLRNTFNDTFHIIVTVLMVGVFLSTIVSLATSCYVYDFSSLYTLSWLDEVQNIRGDNIINVHAGFDETSMLLQGKFPASQLLVFDFYDPLKHTEISIKRARKVYPAFVGTQSITTSCLPLKDKTADAIFTFLSAHEIRDGDERVRFFKELQRILTTDGKIIVTEHLRDTVNFLAYNIGFFHFHSKQTWLKTFRKAGLQVDNEIMITPFITTFILTRNGTTN